MALKDVLIDELRDMYSAENQLVKSLPKLAKGAKSPKLKSLFTAHLAETKGQVERLKLVFSELGEKPTGEHCNGTFSLGPDSSSAPTLCRHSRFRGSQRELAYRSVLGERTSS
jgi:ferritin-like metal-binding protein YciE